MLMLDGFRRFGARRTAALVLLTTCLAVLASSDIVHTALLQAIAGTRVIIEHYPILGPVVFVAFSALSAMLAFVSSALLLPVAVYNWGEPITIALLWLGWLLGGVCSYATGQFLGRSLLGRPGAGKMLGRMESYVGPQTPFGLVLLFQLALPSEIPGYVLGIVRYRFAKYLLGLAIVELLHTVALVHLGASFVDRRIGGLVTAGLVLVAMSAIALYLLRKRIRSAPTDLST